jgi:hypothetical protein
MVLSAYKKDKADSQRLSNRAMDSSHHAARRQR